MLKLTVDRVGGVVSETSFKFFIIFLGWTTIYCVFNLVVAAYFLAEYEREVSKVALLWPPTRTLTRLRQKPRGEATPAVDSLTKKACFNVHKSLG